MTPNQTDLSQVMPLIHLSGGLVATQLPGDACAEVATRRGGTVVDRLPVAEPRELFVALNRGGYRSVGFELYTCSEELEAIWPAQWQVVWPQRGRVGKETETLWHALANTGAQANDAGFFDISSRIAFELFAASLRLRDLGKAYSKQLHGHFATSGPWKEGWFEDLYSHEVRLAVHAAFSELHTCLDYLGEFIARYVLKEERRVDSWSGLLNILKKRDAPSTPLTEMVREVSIRATEKPGWCAELTEYRNVFTHTAPLGQATHWPFTLARNLEVRTGKVVPALKCPLPWNVMTLKQARVPALPYRDEKQLPALLRELEAEAFKTPDTFDYLTMAYRNVVELAAYVGGHSPFEPQPLSLSSEDLA